MSLTDLLKQRNTAAVNGRVQAKKFKLPSIFGQKTTTSTEPVMPNATTDASMARPTKFTNLSDLANAHLSTNKLVDSIQKISLSENINIPKTTKFTIPKLNGDNSSMSPSSTGESLTPHEMSLKKIMDLKRLGISTSVNDSENTLPGSTDTVMTNEHSNATMSVDEQQYPIDLTSALNGPNFDSSSIIAPTKRIVEKIDFKFIDCDIAEESDPFISQDCCLNISNILNENFDTRTKSTTAFGQILCSRYKRKKQSLVQKVQHGFVNKHQIKPFRFDVSTKPSK